MNEQQSNAGNAGAGATVSTIDDTPDVAEVAQTTRTNVKVISGANHDETLSGRKARCIFFDTEGDLGKGPVEAGLNGVAYRWPRNIEVEIPVEVLDSCIGNAVQDTYKADGNSVVQSKQRRFSYQVLGYIDPPKAPKKKAA